MRKTQPPKPTERQARGSRRSPSRRSPSSRTPPTKPPDRCRNRSSVTGTSTPASPATRLLMIIASADHERQVGVVVDRSRTRCPPPDQQAERAGRWRARSEFAQDHPHRVRTRSAGWSRARAPPPRASASPHCRPSPTRSASAPQAARTRAISPWNSPTTDAARIAVPRLIDQPDQPRPDRHRDRLVDVAVARAGQPQRCPRRLPRR